VDKDKTAEEIQKRQQALKELQENPVHQEVLRRLKTRLQTKRKAQRSAHQQSDTMTVFRLEGEIAGVEEALNIYDAQATEKKDNPTIQY